MSRDQLAPHDPADAAPDSAQLAVDWLTSTTSGVAGGATTRSEAEPFASGPFMFLNFGLADSAAVSSRIPGLRRPAALRPG